MKTIGEQQNEARIVRALESISDSLNTIKGYMKVMAANHADMMDCAVYSDFPKDIQEMINKIP